MADERALRDEEAGAYETNRRDHHHHVEIGPYAQILQPAAYSDPRRPRCVRIGCPKRQNTQPPSPECRRTACAIKGVLADAVNATRVDDDHVGGFCLAQLRCTAE